MAKRVSIEADGKEYTLEFCVSGIKKIEDMGFKQAEVFQKLVTSAQLLLYGALVKHQPSANPNTAIRILEALIEDGYELSDLAEVLVELHADALNPNVKPGKVKKLQVVAD